jgi:PAS domain S-box-containing protein
MSFRKKRSLADVTNVKSYSPTNEAFKKSEANLRTIIDTAETSYILFDADLCILSFNLLAQKYSEEINKATLVVGTHISKYFSAGRWTQVLQMLKKAAAGETVSYDLNFINEHGVSKWHNISWVKVINNDNKDYGYFLSNKDITEAKTIALERERVTADLIQHNNDLEQFTYIVSHNLRAPVANILGLTDILKNHDEELDQESKKEVVDRIYTSIKNIDVIIKDLNQILQARKTVEGRKELVDFDSLLVAVKTSVRNGIVNENITFEHDFSAVESMFTTRSYLYSIFYNLISNSIKYRKPNIPAVISIKSQKANNKIALRFKDNGKGIDLDKNGKNIFGLYKRFDNSVEGKGMGLYIVKTQVSTLGGTIQIESKPGEGTEFILLFPRENNL